MGPMNHPGQRYADLPCAVPSEELAVLVWRRHRGEGGALRFTPRPHGLGRVWFRLDVWASRLLARLHEGRS